MRRLVIVIETGNIIDTAAPVEPDTEYKWLRRHLRAYYWWLWCKWRFRLLPVIRSYRRRRK